ncbi:MAG: peptidoglycan-binding domain-containing protein, partial [bacterium]|nr:peptidoglycan-binding domain-containing protein [bacterium]
MKKIVVSIVGLSMIVMMVPGIAEGLTAAELQAQITALTAQLTALQAQLTALTGTPAAACTFARNLYPGVSGADVKCLQQYLNGAGYALAVSGVGSAGNETQYFGSLTQAAVKKWQDANGIVYGAYGGYFGPISQAKYVALGGAVVTPVTPVTPTGGAEGGILGTINSVPASGVEVLTTATGKAVAAINIKAIGDVVVNRLDLNFDHRPWLYISNVIVTDGTTSKTLAVTEAGTSEVTVGSSYLFRIDGLNISIPKDTTKTLTVKVDGVTALPGSDTTEDIILTFAADSVRATDGVGLSQYAPTASLATRTFTVKEGDTANLEITANLDNPKAR